jgi:flagellar biogenesis protein FliO
MPRDTAAASSIPASSPDNITAAVSLVGAETLIPDATIASAQASPGLATSIASTGIALCFVLALAWLALRIINRFQRGKASGNDHAVPCVVRSVPIGQRERLVTVRYRGREYLLGVAAGAVNVIDTLSLRDLAGAVSIESMESTSHNNRSFP